MLHLMKLRIRVTFTVHTLASGLALLLIPCVIARIGGRLHKHLGRITAALVLAAWACLLTPLAVVALARWARG